VERAQQRTATTPPVLGASASIKGSELPRHSRYGAPALRFAPPRCPKPSLTPTPAKVATWHTKIRHLAHWGVARVPASRAGVFLNLEPLVGALLGVLVLGEAWGAGTVVGGALIIGAAVVVSRRSGA
jgi:hypothetical protein